MVQSVHEGGEWRRRGGRAVSNFCICLVTSVATSTAIGTVWYALGYAKGRADGWREGFRKAASLFPSCLEMRMSAIAKLMSDE
jgi:hypothetical protein